MYYATVNMNLFWRCLAHAVYITSNAKKMCLTYLSLDFILVNWVA